VPYYREAWDAGARNAALAGALEELPLLTKGELRRNERSFCREDMKPHLRFTHHTSGSTGTPIASTRTVQEIRQGIALREARSAQWAGVSYSMPRATFSGRIVEPDPASNGPFYRFNYVERQAYLSAFHLKPSTARAYVEALHRRNVRWLTGYAVSYHLLAKLMLEQGLEPPATLRAVITTSEKLTPSMRETMRAAYKCPVYEEYSSVENVCFASECERGRLHVSPDMGVIEIVRPDGTPCEPHEVGSVVATGLLRRYQPLIRYQLGDVAAWDDEPCPCGRTLPVIREIVGRIEDVVVGPDGRQMVRFHGIFVDQPHIREGQVIQETATRIRVKVVGTDGFDAGDEADVVARVRQRLGTNVEVIVENVDEIPRDSSGKFRPVVSMLNKTPSGAPQSVPIASR
jgi:phenylacetate-CoA ligase